MILIKKTGWISLILLAAISFTSCDPENVIDTPVVDTDTLDYVWDATKVVKITLNGASVTESSDYVTVEGSIINITNKGTYEFTGTLTDGQIKVNADGKVRLILNNATISNSTTSPIFIDDADKAIIVLPEGTVNTVTDAANYVITTDSLNSAIYSRDYMAIFGNGKLTVNGNYNSGISSRDELVIESGEIAVTSVGPAIKGKDYLIINDGNFTINSNGDGLKSDKELTANEGFIQINGGTFNITTAGDAISAQSELRINDGTYTITTGGGSAIEPGLSSSKAIKSADKIAINGGTFTINSSDNGIDAANHLLISGGTFQLMSASKPFDSDSTLTVSGGNINITKSYKGISSHKVYFLGGTINVTSTNDCVKATLGTDLTTNDGSSVMVAGSTLLLNTQKGDALDSNGNILLAGGVVVVQGSATSPDDAISYRSAFTITGGILCASGATSLVPDITSTQNTIAIKFSTVLSPGAIINIQNEAGTTVLTYKTAKYAYYFVGSTAGLETGKTYQVYVGGSTTGTSINGYYADGVYTPGIKKGTFTVSQRITKINL